MHQLGSCLRCSCSWPLARLPTSLEAQSENKRRAGELESATKTWFGSWILSFFVLVLI